MKIIEVKVYTFDELSDAAKEKARDWYRNGNEFFSDGIIEDAVTIANLMGIDIDQTKQNEAAIYWSGFSSQGDGACFEGTWRAGNVKLGQVKEHAPLDEKLHIIAAYFEKIAAAFPHSSFRVKHSGHYYHDGCTDFDFTIIDAKHTEIESEEANASCIDLEHAAKLFMKWIYRQLEAEYEYQNANEQVDETIRANEYTFTQDGKRF